MKCAKVAVNSGFNEYTCEHCKTVFTHVAREVATTSHLTDACGCGGVTGCEFCDSGAYGFGNNGIMDTPMVVKVPPPSASSGS